ncbi:F-box/LRR-repeat protein 13 [Citrus clementina]|nr:F-box/LRR-repeat protein 13 [Citrus x clementina]
METHQKQKKEKDSDRISPLHDSILHHILSFLPVKEVVQTSLVSKRWQELWKSLPYLRFQEHDFTTRQRFINLESDFTTRHRFTKFLHYFLIKRDNKSSIIRLAVKCSQDVSDIWTSSLAAFSASVEELDLEFGLFIARYHQLRDYPSCIFSCNFLVTLKLKAGGAMARFPDKFFFPKMKNLQLSEFILPKTFSRHLLKSPNLENLFLFRCGAYMTFSSSDNESDLGIWAKLDEADICLQLPDFNSDGRVSTFVRMLSSVKILHLQDTCIKHLRYERNLSQRLPKFRNLKHLELGLSAENGDIGVMACLLNCASTIKSLHITFADCNPGETGLIPKQFELLFLPPSLKWIRMSEFCGRANQVELLRLLLNSEILEKIIVELDYKVMDPDLLRELRPSTSSCLLEIRHSPITAEKIVRRSRELDPSTIRCRLQRSTTISPMDLLRSYDDDM